MWVSEVKTKKGRKLGSFHHRKSFATMDEGLVGREKPQCVSLRMVSTRMKNW